MSRERTGCFSFFGFFSFLPGFSDGPSASAAAGALAVLDGGPCVYHDDLSSPHAPFNPALVWQNAVAPGQLSPEVVFCRGHADSAGLTSLVGDGEPGATGCAAGADDADAAAFAEGVAAEAAAFAAAGAVAAAAGLLVALPEAAWFSLPAAYAGHGCCIAAELQHGTELAQHPGRRCMRPGRAQITKCIHESMIHIPARMPASGRRPDTRLQEAAAP
jgi:hypothetical protein